MHVLDNDLRSEQTVSIKKTMVVEQGKNINVPFKRAPAQRESRRTLARNHGSHVKIPMTTIVVYVFRKVKQLLFVNFPHYEDQTFCSSKLSGIPYLHSASKNYKICI